MPNGTQLWRELMESENIILFFTAYKWEPSLSSPDLWDKVCDRSGNLLAWRCFFILSSFSCLSAEWSKGGCWFITPSAWYMGCCLSCVPHSALRALLECQCVSREGAALQCNYRERDIPGYFSSPDTKAPGFPALLSTGLSWELMLHQEGRKKAAHQTLCQCNTKEFASWASPQLQRPWITWMGRANVVENIF